jgi:hypothetical protein
MKNHLQLSVAVLFALAGVVAGGEANYPAVEGPYMAVYRWAAANPVGGAPANAAYARWLNRPVVWAEDFTPTQRWEGHIEGGDWQLGEWGQWKREKAGRRLVYSVPLLPGPWDRSGAESGPGKGAAVSLARGAAGEYNEPFRTLAENMVRHGLGDSIVRLGWEFNGGWYTWRAGDDPASYAAYWRQIVRTMRSAPGTERMMFCWNPAQGFQQFAAEKAWPGDDVVDLVGLDLYDDSWAKDTYPWPADATADQIEARRRKVWHEVLLHGDHGLIFWRDFAVQHGKLFCIPEWGVNRREEGHGGLDNVYFIEQMHQFINDPANRVYFHCYFDVEAPDGGHQLSPGIHGDQKTTFPNAAAKFKTLFGK